MIGRRDYRPGDAHQINLQPAQRGLDRDVLDQSMMQSQHATTLVHSDGRILLCAGGVALTSQAMLIHAALADGIGGAMVGLSRIAHGWIEQLPYRRIMAWVNPDHEASLRWIQSLRFLQEGVMPGFGDDGQAFLMFGLVRPIRETQ